MTLTSHMVYKNLILWHLDSVRLTSRFIGYQQNFAYKLIRYFDYFDILWTLKDLLIVRSVNGLDIKCGIKKMI